MLRDRLKKLFQELNCIKYGKFELASGGFSTYKIFCDPLFENLEAKNILGLIGYQMLKKIESERAYGIVGIVTGGYEFAKLVANEAGREAVAVNPHNGEIKGDILNEYICYFEDVVTKGGSILKCRHILEKRDWKDNCAISIVDRQENGKGNLRKNGINLESILTKNELGIRGDLLK